MPHYVIENTSSAAILWDGEYGSEADALAALEAAAGVPDDGWDEEVVIHGWPLAPLKAADVDAMPRVKAHLERIGVADTGQGGCVAQEIEGRPEVVEILDESAGGTYLVGPLLPILANLPTDLDENFAGTDEDAARLAYEAFWRAIASAEVNPLKLSTDDAPPATEPVTVGGWYRLVDGTWGHFVWRSGQLSLVARATVPDAR